MATHKVTMRQPTEIEVNTDVEFVIRENGRKIGELHVSKGSIEWLPSNGRYKRRMRWSKFAELMRDERQVK
jgi:ribonuclease HI